LHTPPPLLAIPLDYHSSFSQDFLLTDDGWQATAALPNLTEIIVEGVSLAEDRPGIMTRCEPKYVNY
jgi:hypothetical protein